MENPVPAWWARCHRCFGTYKIIALVSDKRLDTFDLVLDLPFKDEPELGGHFMEVTLVFRIVGLRHPANDVGKSPVVDNETRLAATAGRNDGIEIEVRPVRLIVAAFTAMRTFTNSTPGNGGGVSSNGYSVWASATLTSKIRAG